MDTEAAVVTHHVHAVLLPDEDHRAFRGEVLRLVTGSEILCLHLAERLPVG